LRETGDRAVLVSGGDAVAEITPVSSTHTAGAERNQVPAMTALDEELLERTEPRVVYSKLTGLPVVMSRPGQRMVTSKEIYEELRNSFP
jgi:hypothetical protein